MPESDDEVAELARTLDQMLRELDAARSETEQMIQAQRDFVADASHELRTPLTSILANLELLEASFAERGADPDEEEIVAGALGSSRRMRRLVADLLLLARADAGRTGPRRPCDLAKVAATAVAEVRPSPRTTRSSSRPRARSRSRAIPTTFIAWSSTWSRTASATRRSGSTISVAVRAGERRPRRDRGRRRRSRAPRGRRRPDLRPLRARQRPRRPVRPTPAPGSAWRSSRRSPSRTAGASRSAPSAAGGARFTVRLPLARALARARRDSLALLYNRAHTFEAGRDTARRGHPRQCLVGHPLASSESEPIRPAGVSPP